MPDDASGLYRRKDFETAVPFALIAVGALSLLRGGPLLGLGLLGYWLYPLAEKADRERQARGRSLKARHARSRALDLALEDTFPASDPPAITSN
jgi:hypothetical protein